MAEFNLPEFSINCSSANEDIVKLMKIVKPLWWESDIQIKTISGGYSCSMYKVSSRCDSNDAVTIKVRNLLAEKNLPCFNRDFERKIIQVMSKLGLFPKIHALLKNGYCYQYVEGKPIFDATSEPAEMKKVFDNEKFPFQLIATKFAEIHSVKLENEDFSKSIFLSNILDVLENHYPDISNPVFTDKQVIHKEFIRLMDYSKNFNFNVVLCHGDPHPGNMVWNEATNEVSFMDWELTSIGLQAFDLAYFLTTVAGAGLDEAVVEEIKKKFIPMYLTEYSKLNNFDLTDEYVTEFERQVKFCSLIWYLMVTIYMGPILADMLQSPKFDKMSEFGNKSFQQYLLVKDKILADLQLI